MRNFLILILLTCNLKAINFALIDSFEDAPNFPDAFVKGGDIDNDGLSEVIFTGEDSITLYNQIYIYERYSSGGFYLAHIVPIYEPQSPWMGGAFYDFAIGDFDEDGKMDICESTYNANNWVEYFEIVESRDTFSYPDTIVWMDSLYIEGNNPILYMWSGDLDNDDVTEIVIHKGSDNENELLIYENVGDNLYALKFDQDYNDSIPEHGLAVGDLDQDTYPEFVFVKGNSLPYPTARFYESSSDDSLALVNILSLVPFSSNFYDNLFVGDVNNNGSPEVMIHSYSPRGFSWTDKVWLIESVDNNEYQITWHDSIPNNPCYPDYGARSSSGDVTGDGIPEIILSLTTGVRVIQYIPGQGYTYIWQKYYAYNTGNISTAVYDINGNGINDIILAVQHQEEHRVTYIYEMPPSVSEKYKKISPYFSVFPNITSDSIRVFYSLKAKNFADFYIYNILGERVYSKKLKQRGKLYLSLKKLKFRPGIYFLKFKSDNFKKMQKIIFLK